MSSNNQPALFVGLSGDAPRSPPARIALNVDRIEIGRGDNRRIDRKQAGAAALVLADARMSTQHARLSRTEANWVIEDLGSKNGTWIGPDRITKRALADGDAVIVGHTVLVFRTGGSGDGDLDGMPAAPAPGLATLSSELAVRFAALAEAARGASPIEIVGERGTGKEQLARAVHALSGRTGEFVAVACGALEESDLPDAIDHPDGTVFLHEIAELAPAVQTALSNALVAKPGARFVIAAPRGLDGEVDAGRFSAELRARLAGVTITVPPLRRRREDLAVLVPALLDRLAPGRAITFSTDVLGSLYAHDWPLNAHELERALGAAITSAADSDRIEAQHLPAAVGSTEPMEQNVFRTMTGEERALRDRLTAAIARHQGNLAGVARELGKDRTQIRRWMKRFGITREGV